MPAQRISLRHFAPLLQRPLLLRYNMSRPPALRIFNDAGTMPPENCFVISLSTAWNATSRLTRINMFIDIGEGWHLNLAHVARIHIVDSGVVGTAIKFYSQTNDHLGDFKPATPEDLALMLHRIQTFGRRESGD